MSSRFSTLLLATTALVPLGLGFGLAPAAANPLGAQVVGGNASVQGQGTANVTVTQSTDKAIINWNTFNIGANEKTQFIQPNSSSIALNRVTGGLGPSQIFGSLSANGRIFVVNPDGILVGPGAKIDTAGFLATTHDIANADFMAGRYNFSIPGRPDASVVNQGTITAQNGGFAALVAPGVRNSGTITARLGTIALASGNGFTLDFYGDKLITLGVNDSIAASVKDVATGQPLSSLVSNEGKLKANGGRVELTAVAARQVVDSVINNKGVIEANSIGTRNGMIVLGAATATSKPAGAPTQTVKISGKLSVAGKKKGTKGGTIQVTSENIALTGATLDASGRSGGGTVLIGGDVGGGNPNPAVAGIAKAALEPWPVPTATTVSVDTASIIYASAKDSGDGGKVVVWADGSTIFNGTIMARGGAQSGNGGFVETSGHQQLAFNGVVDLAAPNGTRGTLLLDPQDVTIGSTGSSIVTVSALVNALLSGNVLVTTGSGSGNGDITVAENVSWSNGNTLILSAYRNIAINNGVTIANTGSGNLDLGAGMSTPSNAPWFGVGTGTIIFNGSGKVDFSHSTGYVSFAYNPPGGYTQPTDFSSFVTTNPAVFRQFNAGMWVNNVNDLQNISQNLAGNYILANNIDASSTASWNGGAGFIPIGNSTTPFIGMFFGVGGTVPFLTLGATIDGLTINSSANDVGLFGNIGSAGTVSNIGLTNVAVTASGGSHVGALAGVNAGGIIRTFASGSLTTSSLSVELGGLIGHNSGGIFQSYTLGPISLSGTGGASSSGSAGAGGLTGLNSGFVSESYAVASIGTFAGTTGQLTGVNSGTIGSSYARIGSYPLIGTNSGSLSVNPAPSLLTDAALKAGLPNGFSSSTWGLSASLNSGYPYLLWQVAGSLPLSLQGSISSTSTPATLPPGTVPFPNLQIVSLSQPVNSPAADSTPLPIFYTDYSTPNYAVTNTSSVVNTTAAINPPVATSASTATPRYTFKLTSSGTVEVWENGSRISTASADYATQRYGYNPSGNTSSNSTPITTAPIAAANPVSPPVQTSTSSSPQSSASISSSTPLISNEALSRLPVTPVQGSSRTASLPGTSEVTGSIVRPPSVSLAQDGTTTISNTKTWTGKTDDGSSAQQLLSELATFAKVSQAVYSGSPIDGSTLPPVKWQDFARGMGESRGMSVKEIDTEIRQLERQGFEAALYRVDGREIVAFGGTMLALQKPLQSLSDVFTNLLNSTGLETSQYEFASGMVSHLINKLGYSDLIVTGHSLGGGLAAYSAARNGIAAITFNAAGVPLLDRNKSYNQILNLEIEGGGVSFGQQIGSTIVIKQNVILSEIAEKNKPVIDTLVPTHSGSTPQIILSAQDSFNYRHSAARFEEVANDKSIRFVPITPNVGFSPTPGAQVFIIDQ